MTKNVKIIVAISIGIVVVVAGYFYMTSGSAPSSDQGVVAVSSDDIQNQIGKQLLSTLDNIKGITLDKDFVESPLFLSLQDFSIPISPQPVGRTNPFAPVGGSVAPVSSTK